MAINKKFVAENGLDNNNKTISNVADPVNDQDVATKKFSSNADNLTSGTIPDSRISSSFIKKDANGNVGIDVNSTSNALRITQTGSGNALLVEDSTTPDATPFVVDSSGNVGIGINPSVSLEVRKSATGSNVIQRVGISGKTKNPYLESKFDETNGLVTLNASGSSTPAFTFEIAQAEKMRIDTSGNVGVGTSNPFNASGYGSLTLNGPTGSITSYQVNGTEKFRIQAMADSTSINSFGTNPLTIYTNNAERMRIGANGDVGIGTGVPGAKLQVVGSSTVAGYNNVAAVFGAGVSSELYVGSLNGTAPFIASGNAYPLLFQTNGSERMRIDANGKVGIGTNAPAAVLDVNGASASNIVAVAASDIDCSLGNYFTKTINGATTFTFSNVPASRAFSFVLVVNHTSGSITWPASVSWPNGTTPTLTTGKTHLFVFVTSDGGTTWRGNSSVNY